MLTGTEFMPCTIATTAATNTCPARTTPVVSLADVVAAGPDDQALRPQVRERPTAHDTAPGAWLPGGRRWLRGYPHAVAAPRTGRH